MIDFEQAGRLLDEYAEALPPEIFEGLNGGVNLIPEARRDENGILMLGLYHNEAGMGRYVEIFYGSLLEAYGGDDGELSAQLRETLYHELTHHVEGLAGDRSLEHWDEEQLRLWEQGEPLAADSVLFADGGEGLASQAEALFRDALPEVRSGWTDLASADAALISGYDAVLCMTLAQAEALAGRFPAFDERILCLGERDLLPGHGALGRAAAVRRLKKEIRLLAEELREGGAEASQPGGGERGG